MDLRLRFTDLFAFVGILLLIATVPAYVAQDEAPPEASSGWEGTFPKPRDGARMEIEMVATWKGGEPVVVGPVWTHAVRAVEPGEVPVNAVFVYERERLPLHVDLGWGVYRAGEYLERSYFDAAGAFVWRTEHMLDSNDQGDPVMEVRERRILGEVATLNRWSGVPLHYDPSIARLAFADAGRNLMVEISNGLMGGEAPHHYALARPTVHREMTLYGIGIEYLAETFGEGGPCAGCQSHPIESNSLTIKDGFGPEKWLKSDGFDWVHRDWPIPVGPHMWYYDENATEVFLETAFVPRVLERGTGQAFEVQWQRYGSLSRGPFDVPRAEPVDLGSYRLGDLASDVRPLHKGVSAADLSAILKDRGFQGRLMEFYWVDHGPEERHQAITSPLPALLPAGPQDEVVQIHPMTWFVTTASWNGSFDVVAIDLERSAEGIAVLDAYRVCEDPRSHWELQHVWCVRTFDPAIVDRERIIGDPIKAIEAAARKAGVDAKELSAFAYLPLYHQYPEEIFRDSKFGPRIRIQEFWGIYPADARLPYGYWGQPDRFVTGVAAWRTNQTDGHTTGSFDIQDGGAYSHTTFRQARPHELAPSAMTAIGTVTPGVLVTLQVVGKSALAGGFLLVAISFFSRFFAWFKAGGTLPLIAAFYAKIARSDVLLNERRNEIMELVRADPGVTASEIARRMGYGWGATVHHLETLAKNGFLVVVARNGKRHYFTTEDGTHRSRAEDAARRDPGTEAFLDAVAARPGATLKELAEVLSRSGPGLSRMGSRLVKDGLVRKQRDGMSIRFWPIGSGQASLEATPAEEDSVPGEPAPA